MKHLCSKCSLIWFVVNNTNIYYLFQCKPELKVPGLYVVDSIVRQSRHQFGIDKDVFGPRFLKNFTDTFQNLYHCSEDDKVLYACSLVFFWYLQEIRIRNNSSVGFFFSFVRTKLSVCWTCGKRMACLTWKSFSLWWIWQTELLSLSLPLHWKVDKENV